MSMPATAQSSFYDPEFVYPDCLERGTVPWLLARYVGLLCPLRLIRQWERPGQPGRKPWPTTVLLAFVVLRFRGEGMSRRAAVRQAKNNAEWRAAMRLSWTDKTPGMRVLARFERFLQRRDPETTVPRYLQLFAHIGRVCMDAGVLGEQPVWAMDSTPMLCFGAVLDTLRQLGDGVRSLAKEWARVSGTTLEMLAVEWDCPLLEAKSTKGHLSIDWSDGEACAAAVDELAYIALDVAKRVRSQVEAVRANKRKGLLRRCRNLARVVSQDLEADEKGRLVVAKRVMSDRLISVTDPSARHGRKSRSRTFNGFKLHVLGDVVSGFIASLCVTPGNFHDSTPACRLIERARELVGELERVLGDTAYGAAKFRYVVKGITGVEIIAPPPMGYCRPGQLAKQAFEVDFDANTVTCPAGVTVDALSSWSRHHGMHIPTFKWNPKTCAACLLHDRCMGNTKAGKRILLHPYERELRAAREAWEQPEVRHDYRTRTQCERLVNQLTRHGGRQARTWGLGPAQLQAHTIAIGCNLELLAQRLAT